MHDTSLSRAQIEAQVRALGAWFHNLDLGGVHTAPDHFLGDYPRIKWDRFAHALPADLTGKAVLDIGCNAGFYALEMKRRGASLVVGIDSDDRYLSQARLAARVVGLDIELERLSVYDIGRFRRTFDIVLFMGVLYHLRYPLLALDLIHDEVAADMLVFQTMLRGTSAVATVEDDYPFSEREIFEDQGYPRMSFVERSYANDPTNWWIPNRAGAEAMLRAAGFIITAHPEEEVFVCRRTAADREPLPSAFLEGRAR